MPHRTLAALLTATALTAGTTAAFAQAATAPGSEPPPPAPAAPMTSTAPAASPVAATDAPASSDAPATSPATAPEASPAPAPDAPSPADASAAPTTSTPPAAAPATTADAPAASPATPPAAAPADAATTPADDAAPLEKGQPTADMAAVLDKLAELGADPIGTLTPEEQRQQPTPADAVMAVMKDRGIAMPTGLAAIRTQDVSYTDAAGGQQPIRIYTPEGEGPFPLIVYYHGGGWVIADIDTYDASARALAESAKAVVASVEYRHAPESRFPAAHEDANLAYRWLVENSGSLNADAERLAVAGESAGANLAMNVAINARDAQLAQPDHMLLVYPVAGNDMDTPSYQTYADAQPLSKPAMEWFVSHVFADPSQTADPRLDLVDRTDLSGLPPASVINAQIDPLLSEGERLAKALQEQGVETTQKTYDGVTHEFFGMGTVVPEAKEAMTLATTALSQALGVK